MCKDLKENEVLAELNNEWNTLKLGNPIPGLYVQTGTEVVRVRGSSQVVGEVILTKYEIIITDNGKVVGSYHVTAEESAEDVERGYS
jgi:hypothetical protein